MKEIERWAAQSPMSDPGPHAAAIAGLPDAVGSLSAIIQGVLVHADWWRDYGLDPAALDASARRTLPVAERLADVLRRDPRPFGVARSAGQRSTGTCRDYALLLAAFLRCKGVPARVRCGFAAYFDTAWEDHWVCEYRDAAAGTWRLADAQIDPMLRARNRITFDAADMPRSVFLTAGEAWRACRGAGADPGAFGHGNVTGLWFVKVNLLRDHLVLNGRETSPWDRWREAPEAQRLVREEELPLLDDLAASPAQPLVGMAPDWLA